VNGGRVSEFSKYDAVKSCAMGDIMDYGLDLV
jgi:hypothetical protein